MHRIGQFFRAGVILIVIIPLVWLCVMSVQSFLTSDTKWNVLPFVMLTILMLLIPLVYIGKTYVLPFYWEKLRTHALKQQAHAFKFSFARKDKQLHTLLQSFSLLHPRPERGGMISRFFEWIFQILPGQNRVYNILSGVYDNITITYFDYTYTSPPSGDEVESLRHHHHSGLILNVEQTSLPIFQVSPLGMFDTIKKWLGFRGIVFDGCPIFHEKYSVQGTSQEAIRACFTPEVLRYLEKHSHRYLESNGTMLLYYIKRERVEPDRLELFFQEGVTLFNLFTKN